MLLEELVYVMLAIIQKVYIRRTKAIFLQQPCQLVLALKSL